MSTLVTGGAGFVGSNIVRGILEQGHQVVCFDLTPADALLRSYLDPWADSVTFVQGDILKLDDLRQVTAASPIDKIVHAAVFTPSRADNLEARHSRDIISINIEGTANLLDMAVAADLKRFVYVSSEAVYGDAVPGVALVNEDSPLRPRNLYAVGKYTSELLTRRYGELYGFETASVRLSYPYGPMERVTSHRTRMSLLYQWTGNVVRNEPIVVEDRSMARDYTFVGDVAAGIQKVLDAPALPHDVYNVSAGRAIALEEVITNLIALRPAVRVVDAQVQEQLNILPPPVRDASRIQADLGFSMARDMSSGLKAYLEWRETTGFTD